MHGTSLSNEQAKNPQQQEYKKHENMEDEHSEDNHDNCELVMRPARKFYRRSVEVEPAAHVS